MVAVVLFAHTGLAIAANGEAEVFALGGTGWLRYFRRGCHVSQLTSIVVYTLK